MATRRNVNIAFAILVVIVVLTVLYVRSIVVERQQFKTARDRQWAKIERLGDYPPAGESEPGWRNALGTLYNVWGNVLHEPAVTTPAEMALLQSRLDEIVAKATAENSVESVDRIYELLLERPNAGGRDEFIQGYREEFREAFMLEN